MSCDVGLVGGHRPWGLLTALTSLNQGVRVMLAGGLSAEKTGTCDSFGGRKVGVGILADCISVGAVR